MKKEMKQKVKLSKTAKKVLAGVLAASMVFSGTMTSFVQNTETVNAEEAAVAETTPTAIGLEIVKNNKKQNNAVIGGNSEDRLDTVKFGEAGESPKGIEVKNPFAGKTELNETVAEAVSNSGVVFNGMTRSYNGNAHYIGSDFKAFAGFDFSNLDKVQTKEGQEVCTLDKAEIQKVYDEARSNMAAATADAVKLLGLVASGSATVENQGVIDAAEAIVAASGDATAISPESVIYTFYGSQRGHENPGDPSAVSGEFTYPLPTYTQGVTISTWVKVPEDAKWTAPIFTFQDVTTEACTDNGSKTCPDALTLRTDGQFMYTGSIASKGNAITNYYNSEFQGETPYANKGEWVYVTLTIANDEVNVYYNGVKATEVINQDQSKAGKAKAFNGGFGMKCYGADADARIQALASGKCYPQILAGCTSKEDYADKDNYTYSSARLMMNFLTDSNTKFFLGGDDGADGSLYISRKIYVYGLVRQDGSIETTQKKLQKDPDGTQPSWGQFSKWSEGMELDNMTTADYVMDATEVQEAYEAAQTAVKDDWIELIKLENEEILANKAELKAAIAAKKAAEALALAEAEDKMATDVNAVSVTAVDAEGSSATVENGVITFDRIYGITGEAAGVGVYLDNPFEGKYDLAESLEDALNGKVNALTSHIDYKNDGLYMHLKYAEFNGFKLADVTTKIKDASGNEIKVRVGQKIQLDAPEKDVIKNKATAISAYEKAEAAMKAATGQATNMLSKVDSLNEVTPDWCVWDNDRVKELATKIVNNTLTDQDIVFTWEGARFIGLPNHENDVNPSPAAIEGEINYPIPEYSQGVTVSSWVKVKKGTKWAAPIFSFENGNDGLVLRTDGTFVFADELLIEGKNASNIFNAKYTGFTPFDNQDTWVYVTMTIKNDEIHVYYNGEEATQNFNNGTTKAGKKYVKKINGGFGLAAWGATADKRKLLSEAIYPQLLENYESGDTDFTDVSKYAFSTKMRMMDLLVNPATEFYIGGGNNDNGLQPAYGQWIIHDNAYNCFYPGYDQSQDTWVAWNRCTTFNSGLKVADISTLDYVVNATEAKALFNIQDSRDYIKADETGFEVKNLNAEENNATEGTATVGTDEIKVITLGKHNDDECDYAKGVELANPFKGKTELSESVANAFKNNGKKFNGLTYTYTKDVYEEGKVVDQETYTKVATSMNTFAGFRVTNKYVGNWLDGRENSGGQFWTDNDSNYKKDPLVVDGVGLKRYALQEKAAFVTKADALYAYNTARNFLLDNNYIGSDGYAAQWLAEMTAKNYGMQNAFVTPYAVKLASIEKAEDLTPAAVQYIYDGPARNPEGNLTDITTVKDEFSYPMPKWTKGVTISTWVKVPETAQWSTPIYTFADNSGLNGLTLRTDGTLMYLADGAGNGEESNYFVANYAGDTPFANKGKWVYVTLSVKNDEFVVYYNGKRATETVSSQVESAGGKAGNGFNFGFRYSNAEDRLKNLLLGEEAYADLLKNFDVDATDYSDVTKYNVAFDTTSVMKFLTANGTKLYVGGYCKAIYSDNKKIWDVDKTTVDPTTNKTVAWGGYSDHAEGMQVGGFSFGFEPISDSEARMLYNDTQLEDEIDVPYSEEPSTQPSEGTTPSTQPSEGTTPSTQPSENVTPSAPATTAKLGDVDGNGSVELKDAQAALKIALKIEKNPTAEQIAAGDIDGNGTVELKDAQAILKEALKITENFKAK